MKNKNKDKEKVNPDFSFKDIHKDIDDALDKKQKEEEKEHKVPNISDKIKQGLEIKNNPPEKRFLNVEAKEGYIVREDEEGDQTTEKVIVVKHNDEVGEEHVTITKGIFTIDLRNDADWWFTRTPEVIPQLLENVENAAIARKDCYKPDKRKKEYPWITIALIIIGAFIITAMVIFLFLKTGA